MIYNLQNATRYEESHCRRKQVKSVDQIKVHHVKLTAANNMIFVFLKATQRKEMELLSTRLLIMTDLSR